MNCQQPIPNAVGWCTRQASEGMDYCYQHRSSAQADFVAAWRQRNPYRTVADTWPCPLCGLSVFVEGGEMPSTLKTRIEHHQRFHGPDWLAYTALGEPQEG